MFQDQLNPIWYNVWLDPNLRNKTTNLPLELHLLLQYSYVCLGMTAVSNASIPSQGNVAA